MKAILKKLFGLTRMVAGILLIIGSIGTFFNLQKEEIPNSFGAVAVFLPIICMVYYGFYLFYGGFYNFKNELIKYKLIVWISLLIGISFIITYLSLISDSSVNLAIITILLLSFFSLPIIIDLIDIINCKRENKCKNVFF